MARKHNGMRPQDIVVLLQLALSKDHDSNLMLSVLLDLSPAEISLSIERCKYAGLLSEDRLVMKEAFYNFLVYGVKYVFPVKPGALVRGIPTAHSAAPLNKKIKPGSEPPFVWPAAHGTMRGQEILPFYDKQIGKPLVVANLYETLALIDALRVGKAREVNLAKELLKNYFFTEQDELQNRTA